MRSMPAFRAFVLLSTSVDAVICFAPGSAVIERFAELTNDAYGLGLVRKLIGRFFSHVLPKSRGTAESFAERV